MIINQIKHYSILIYIFCIFLNYKIFYSINIDSSNIFVNFVINEITIADIVILIFLILYVKEILNQLISICKDNIHFIFLIFATSFIGILYSFIVEQNKPNQSLFIFFFYINLIRIFFGTLIFVILYKRKENYYDEKIIFLFAISIIFLCCINFILNEDLSRLYYPFTNKTNGYNLIGLVGGSLFFLTYNFYFNVKKNFYILCLTILFFLIVFFSFSKTAIIALVFTHIISHIFINKKKRENFFFINIIILIIVIMLSDLIKYTLDVNSFSFIDIIIDPVGWYNNYGSFYYRIDHVWLSGFDKELNIFIFLFGEGLYSPKTHDSLYFTIISRFGFIGFAIFLYLLLEILKNVRSNFHNQLIFILIFGLTTEMIIQSNIINPLMYILIYLNYKISEGVKI